MTALSKKYSLAFSLMLIFILSGCQTSGGLSSLGNSISSTASETANSVSGSVSSGLSSLNPFTKRERDFIQHIENSNFSEANNLLNSDKVYFQEYFKENDKAPLFSLSNHLFDTKYKNKIKGAKDNLKNCNPKSLSSWDVANDNLKNASIIIRQANNEVAIRMAGNKEEIIKNLRVTSDECKNLFTDNINEILTSYPSQIIDKKIKLNNYPVNIQDYRLKSSQSIQRAILEKLTKYETSSSLRRRVEMLETKWVSENSKSKIDNKYLLLLKNEFLKDGVTTFEEAVLYEKNKGGIFGKGQYEGPLLKIGYIDLDQKVNPNTSIPFEVDLDIDIEIPVKSISGNLNKNNLKKFDMIIFKIISDGEVDKDFKDKSTPNSKYKSGTRQVPNPAYPAAYSAYQSAVQRQTQIEADTSLTDSCRGTAQCLAAGFAQGMARGAAADNTKRASTKLGNTPQTLAEPVFQSYQYRTVEVNAQKIANIKYGLIDTKNKNIKSNIYKFKKNNKFALVYGVHQNDPNKRRIENRFSKEDEILDWESENISMKMSKLISSDLLREDLTFTETEEIQSYFSALSNINQNVAKKAARKISNSSVIADSRFDSVVLIKTGSGLGTGFYVKPDVILTAYHVVEGHSLVQLNKFDKTSGTGTVVDHDIRLDLALVRTNIKGPILEIFSGPLPLGESVEAIGHPQGLEFTITRGVISALRLQESVYTEGAAQVEFVQSDTPISPGNSGGPLFMGNKVIGVADFGNVKEFSQNLNFSVSYNEINAYLAKNGIY